MKREKKAHIWPLEPNQWYVEPKWCSERLFSVEPFEGSVWDPFAGSGQIVASATESRLDMAAYGTDILDRGFSPKLAGTFDFTQADPTTFAGADNIVTNPPYDSKRLEGIITLALALTKRKVTMLLPLQWIVSNKRSLWLETTPLRRILCLTPRPSLPPGQVAYKRPDEYLVPEPEMMEQPRANGNVDFAWYIWEHAYKGPTEIGWCRRDP